MDGIFWEGRVRRGTRRRYSSVSEYALHLFNVDSADHGVSDGWDPRLQLGCLSGVLYTSVVREAFLLHEKASSGKITSIP